ncbi:MAG TPA: protein-tyrosine phosphatase family protein [Nannocystis sp.]
MPERPYPNSYWVRPGLLLAGEYPGAREEAVARDKIGRLLAAGVQVFIDLTEPGELEPYAPLLQAEARARGAAVEHLRFAIRDKSVPSSPALVDAAISAIDAALAASRAAYVHCWGGIGRTGTIVGCWLVSQGASGEEALAAIAGFWRTVEKVHRRPRSPETDEQCDYVRRWRPGR